jgi:hypothetical protein
VFDCQVVAEGIDAELVGDTELGQAVAGSSGRVKFHFHLDGCPQPIAV